MNSWYIFFLITSSFLSYFNLKCMHPSNDNQDAIQLISSDNQTNFIAKSVLLRYEYFKQMFSSQMKEAQTHTIKLDIDGQTLNHLVKLIALLDQLRSQHSNQTDSDEELVKPLFDSIENTDAHNTAQEMLAQVKVWQTNAQLEPLCDALMRSLLLHAESSSLNNLPQNVLRHALKQVPYLEDLGTKNYFYTFIIENGFDYFIDKIKKPESQKIFKIKELIPFWTQCITNNISKLMLFNPSLANLLDDHDEQCPFLELAQEVKKDLLQHESTEKIILSNNFPHKNFGIPRINPFGQFWQQSYGMVKDHGKEAWIEGNETDIGIRDIATGTVTTLQGHADAVTALVFYDQGKKLVSASTKEDLKLWDAQTGQAIGILPNSQGITSLIKKSNDTLVSKSSHAITIWNLNTGHVKKTFECTEYQDKLLPLQKNAFVSYGNNQEVDLWDINRGKTTPNLFGYTEYIKKIKTDDKLAIIASNGELITKSSKQGLSASLQIHNLLLNQSEKVTAINHFDFFLYKNLILAALSNRDILVIKYPALYSLKDLFKEKVNKQFNELPLNKITKIPPQLNQSNKITPKDSFLIASLKKIVLKTSITDSCGPQHEIPIYHTTEELPQIWLERLQQNSGLHTIVKK